MKSELYCDSAAQSLSPCHLILILQQPYDIKGHKAHKTQRQNSSSDLFEKKGLFFFHYVITDSFMIAC